MFSSLALPLPYAQATPAQRAQLLRYLQDRLRPHFPTLPERSFTRALAEFQPPLLLTSTQTSLPDPDLLQFAQYLAWAPELPLLNPPLFGPWALELAQYLLHLNELLARTLPELVARPPIGDLQRESLLRYITRPHPLAERIVQAQRWDLPGSPRLPPGDPGTNPVPGSPASGRRAPLLTPGTG